MKNSFKVIAFYAVLIIAILWATTALLNTQSEKIGFSDIVKYFEDETVEEFHVDDDNTLYLTFKAEEGQEPKTVKYKLRSLELFEAYLGNTIREQSANGIITSYEYTAPTPIPIWVSFLPYIIIAVVFIVIWFSFMNQTGKGGKMNSFGRARTKLGSDEKNKVLFTDVAGADEEKEELVEIVEFLKNPQKFTDLGARIPKGVLLVGPPGTGKTLLAKAVAGEAGVPFYSISGSDFVEMYVGVGASRVRDLFETAKKTSPSIVFIDEIDAVGRHRGAGLGGGHDEREQTLNQLLVEMDGFGINDGVIVMAATNRPDILDPALLRPGRFDRQVTVNYPDINGREAILKVHSKNKPFEKNVDMLTIAKTTVGFTGADLANLLNEAALLAARKGKRLIGMKEIEEASIKIIVGTSKKSLKRNELETKMTAYHEAGHAIAHFALPTLDPVQQISIIPTARTGGYTLSVPQEDHYFTSRRHMQEEIVSLLGGRVAEFLVFDDFTTGASNDIQRATSLARNMVTRYGMSDKLGSVVYGSEHGNDEVFLGRDFSNTKNYSEKTASEIDDEIRFIVDDAYNKCTQIIKDNMDKLNLISDYLIKNEIMDAEQFKFAMENDATVEELEKIRDEKHKMSAEENVNAEKKSEETTQETTSQE
ncbi:MAG: ATP-dependent zinc metalloprotease FtsH [Ruminococcaceae bacterium]|nr:ATP-dependent zinc metalloprotease FtsH [Oscillospiraceae bacterium]